MSIRSEVLKWMFMSLLFGLIVMFYFLIRVEDNRYILLSRSILHGKAYFDEVLPSNTDVIFWQGKRYWPLGVLPAVLLVPFALFNFLEGQGVFQLTTVFLVAVISWYLTKTYKKNNTEAFWLWSAFMFGSVLFQAVLIRIDWMLAHVVGVLFGLLGVIMTFKKKWLLAGLMWGLAFLSRPLMILGSFFSVGLILSDGVKLRKLGKLIAPLFLVMFVSHAYNWIRFGSADITQQYRMANLVYLNSEERGVVFADGLFNTKYVLRNIYFYFLRIGVFLVRFPYVKFEYPGLSLFLASPVFIFLFGIKRLNNVLISALLAIFVIVSMLMTYYWPGWNQIGPRYLIDAMPLIYVLFLERFKDTKIGAGFKFGVIWGALVTIVFAFQAFIRT